MNYQDIWLKNEENCSERLKKGEIFMYIFFPNFLSVKTPTDILLKVVFEQGTPQMCLWLISKTSTI